MKYIIDLEKSRKRDGLVPKKVIATRKDGTTYSTTVYVRADKSIANTTSKQSKFDINKFNSLKSNKSQALNYLKECGVTWKENKHEGINWMYAMMEVKKLSQPTINSSRNQIQNKPIRAQSDIAIQPQYTDYKETVKEMANKHGRNNLMKLAKEQGITWKEDAHEGINWMRASMAIRKHLEDGGTLNINKTKPKVENTKPKKLTPKQLREQNINNILQDSTEEQANVYKTLGIAAADSKAQEYLTDFLFPKYKKSIEQMVEQKMKNHTKFSGAINKQIVNSMKSVANVRLRHVNTKKAIFEGWVDPNKKIDMSPKKKVTSLQWQTYNKNRRTEEDSDFHMIEKALNKLESHKDYSEITKEWKKDFQMLKELCGNSHEFITMAVTSVTSRDKSDLQLLNELAQKREEYKEKMQRQKVQQKIEKNLKGILKKVEHTKEYKRLLEAQKKGEYASFIYDNYMLTVNPRKFAIATDPNTQSIIQIYKVELNPDSDARTVKVLDSSGGNKEVKFSIREDLGYIDPGDKPDYKHRLKVVNNMIGSARDINRLSTNLLNSKYSDLLTNLYFFSQAGKAIASSGWELQHNMLDNLQVLSKDDINKSKSSPDEFIEYTSLMIGKLKPSLSKKGNKSLSDIESDLKGIIEENKELLKTYGQTSSSMLKLGDIKCIISSVAKSESKQIIDKINKDWDLSVHRGMKPKILGVYKISDLTVEQDFNRLKSKRGNQSQMFYHGTGSLATALILGKSGQFKVGKAKVGRMLGDGIYLADTSSKSAQYISDEGFTRKKSEGSLMICEASLGRIVDDPRDKTGDTVAAVKSNRKWNHLKNNEWCVRNPKAVLPRYLVHIKLL